MTNYVNYRSEYGAFWKCIQAGGIYVFTQLCKMLVLATFFDSDALSGAGGTGDFNFLAVSRSKPMNCGGKMILSTGVLKFIC